MGPLEKTCKSVVSSYTFTVNIFLIVDTDGSEKHSFVGRGGGGLDPSGLRPIHCLLDIESAPDAR